MEMWSCASIALCSMQLQEENFIYINILTKIVKTENIRLDGCHIVPVAHPNSKQPNLQFRISFSATEKYLIQNWNKNQKNIYFLCKKRFNKFFRTGQDLEKGLCSYFAKTILLWTNERYSKEFWGKKSTVSIVDQFIDDLRTNIINKNCPSYFVMTQ